MRTRRAVFGLVAVSAVLAAGCDWPMPGFDSARTGFNRYEHQVGAGNVTTLQPAWSTVGGNAQIVTAGSVISRGLVGPRAYDVTTGALRWTASPGFAASEPASDGRTVFVSTPDTLFAYDARGATNCTTATPASCTPEWLASVGGTIAGSPAVSDGTVYVATDIAVVQAYDTNPTECQPETPPVCRPRWSVQLSGSPRGEQLQLTAPAIGNGHVFVSSQQGVISSIPTSGGAAEWQADVNPSGDPGVFVTPPTVAGGRVYVGWGNAVYVFDAAGSQGCVPTIPNQPKACSPLYTLDQSNPVGIAVANGHVSTTGLNDSLGMRVYDAAGVNGCSGTPKVCHPLWTDQLYSAGGPPVVANGVAYVTTFSYDEAESERAPRVQAFDASGTTNCSGSPKVCTELWRQPLGTADTFFADEPPIVVNGMVYGTASDGVHAYRLP